MRSSAVAVTKQAALLEGVFLALRRITSLLGSVEPLRLLIEPLRRWSARTHYQIQVRNVAGRGIKFNCCLHSHIGSQIFWYGRYNRWAAEVIRRFLPADGCVIDVGANEGEFSLVAASFCRSGKIAAIEPGQWATEQLRANISSSGFGNIEVLALAVGLGEGTAVLSVPNSPGEDGTLNVGMAYLSSIETAATGEVQEKVPVSSLDRICAQLRWDRIDLIKIDVEGGELDVLNGASGVISRYNPIIVVEVNHETLARSGHSAGELIDWFLSRGYALRRLTPTRALVEELPSLEDAPFMDIIAAKGLFD